jgi:hypothetical protein
MAAMPTQSLRCPSFDTFSNAIRSVASLTRDSDFLRPPKEGDGSLQARKAEEEGHNYFALPKRRIRL